MGRVLILVREKVQILKLSATLGKTSQITPNHATSTLSGSTCHQGAARARKFVNRTEKPKQQNAHLNEARFWALLLVPGRKSVKKIVRSRILSEHRLGSSGATYQYLSTLWVSPSPSLEST